MTPGSAARSCTHKGKRDSLFGADAIQSSKQWEIEDAGPARSDGCGMGDHLAVAARQAAGRSAGGRPAGSFTSCAPARRGATFRNAAGRMQQSATAGPGKGCGSACSRRWRRARRDLFISSTPRCARPPARRGRKKGGPDHAIGRSRGGLSTKIHVVVDGRGLPRRFVITPGQASDKAAVPALLDGLEPARDTVADRGYDARTILKLIADHGSCPHIPTQRDRREQRSVSHDLYRQRNLVERFFNKLKHFRGIATRYHKLARNFLAAIALACIRLWIKTNEYTT